MYRITFTKSGRVVNKVRYFETRHDRDVYIESDDFIGSAYTSTSGHGFEYIHLERHESFTVEILD